MNKQEDGFVYNVMYHIFYFLGFIAGRLFQFFKKGLVYAWKNKSVLIGYIVLVLFSLLFPPMMIVTILVVITVGLWQYIKEAPFRRLSHLFESVFTESKLIVNGQTPSYHSHEVMNEYTTVYQFYNLVPITEWNKKKEQLELYLDATIIDIKQDQEDKRFLLLYVQDQPLSGHINWEDCYIDQDHDILNIGMSHMGLVGMNLETYPHAFIAGETGSGKSNVLKCMVYQSLQKGYDVTLIDFKRGVVFSKFEQFVPIYYEYQETLEAFKEIIEDIKNRLDLFRKFGVEKLSEFNHYNNHPLKRKIIFIDELAELLSTRDKETSKILYESIEIITRLSRAVGIHLIMGIQRPDSTVINGQIKSNVPYRLCGHFTDREPSRIMLGNDDASTIQNIKGRFIVKEHNHTEVQCFYYDHSIFKPSKNKMNDMKNHVSKEKDQPSEDVRSGSSDELEESSSVDTMDFDFEDVTRY